MLLEKLSLAGIARATGISASRHLNFSSICNHKYQEIPHEIQVIKKNAKLVIQCDAQWSFVSTKQNKVLTWLTEDVQTREFVGVFIDKRDKTGAEGLWQSLLPIYRQRAILYTDFWEAYTEVFPFKRHKAVDKASGKTSKIERLNNTLRQRISRLVRKALSFSKNLSITVE